MRKTTENAPGGAQEKTPPNITPETAALGRKKGLEVRRENSRRRKSFLEQLEALDFDIVHEAVSLYRDPDCPYKVKADLLGKFTAQVFIRPKDQLASDTQRDIITDLFAFVSQGGRPLPPTIASDVVAVLPVQADPILTHRPGDDPED